MKRDNGRVNCLTKCDYLCRNMCTVIMSHGSRTKTSLTRNKQDRIVKYKPDGVTLLRVVICTKVREISQRNSQSMNEEDREMVVAPSFGSGLMCICHTVRVVALLLRSLRM